MAAKAITVTLSEMAPHAERHLASDRYASMSGVMRAGLRALNREEAVLEGLSGFPCAAGRLIIRPPWL